MKFGLAAVAGLIFILMLGDYLFWLFAFLLGIAALWCLYRAITSYQEWQMPEDKWLAKVEAEELAKKGIKQEAPSSDENAEEQAAEPKHEVLHHRRSRPKRTKADGFVVIMFALMSLIPGCLSYQAVNFRDDGLKSSSSMPAANFSATSTTIEGHAVSGRSASPTILYLAAGLGFIFLGASSGIASVVAKKKFPQYVKPITGAAAAFMLLGAGCLALNMTGGANKSADMAATSATVASDGGTSSEQGGATAEKSEATGDDGKEKSQDDVTVLGRAAANQDKAAVKQYIERENPFAMLDAAKKQCKFSSAETADAVTLKRYLFAVSKLSEGSLEPKRIIKGAEETAKVYEAFYSGEALIVTEWQQAKAKKAKPDDIKLAEMMKKRDDAEKEIRRLAAWSEAKL